MFKQKTATEVCIVIVDVIHTCFLFQFLDLASVLVHEIVGPKGGEFYTPRSVVRLIVELLERKEKMHICDPTAGSGGMLIYTAQYVKERGAGATYAIWYFMAKSAIWEP